MSVAVETPKYLDDVTRASVFLGLPAELEHRLERLPNTPFFRARCGCGKLVVRLSTDKKNWGKCNSCIKLPARGGSHRARYLNRLKHRNFLHYAQSLINCSTMHLEHIRIVKASKGAINPVDLARMEAEALNSILGDAWLTIIDERLPKVQRTRYATRPLKALKSQNV